MTPEIITAERKHGHADVRLVAATHPSSFGDRTPPNGVALDVTVAARVDKGRWIADCPDPACHGAEYVSFDKPLFFCCECRNAAVSHAAIPVAVPGPMKRRHIETYLRARPDWRTRNWSPSESIAQLRDENRAHGIVLPRADSEVGE